jgi:hypothetical protein
MYALFTRSLTGFVPADEEAGKLFKRVSLGEIVSLEGRQPRNLKWHRKYWVLIGVIQDNISGVRSKEDISDAIKIGIGHTRKIVMKRGTYEIPKSISFAKMSQSEWEVFWDLAIKFVCSEILPGMDNDVLTQQVLELTEFNP